MALVTLCTIGLSFCGALTVTDEVKNDLHLLSEAQRSDLNHLGFVMGWTLLGFNGNFKRDLEPRAEFKGSLNLTRKIL